MEYKLLKNVLTNNTGSVLRLSDGASIPFDPANTDYQEYLKWVEDGGVPEEADEKLSKRLVKTKKKLKKAK
jgi:hypothetical protein